MNLLTQIIVVLLALAMIPVFFYVSNNDENLQKNHPYLLLAFYAFIMVLFIVAFAITPLGWGLRYWRIMQVRSDLRKLKTNSPTLYVLFFMAIIIQIIVYTIMLFLKYK